MNMLMNNPDMIAGYELPMWMPLLGVAAALVAAIR